MWLLKRSSIHKKVIMTGEEKCDFFNTGDCMGKFDYILTCTFIMKTSFNSDSQ